ncbi:hypothetical protein [Micromonospora sp. CNB394]|uniref:hypothetical protein n=1 Tax=Micromonospora sp. CNB394 TaxID=1169151 RepID=UPI0003800BA4|nr:hypothetical protein [Micromonospora sp. CNB394]
MDAVLDEIAAVRSARERLDEHELGLVERARLAGATWTAIAEALGVASRQAAQQRHQRLLAALRSRRHHADLDYAAELSTLRDALADLERWIRVDRVWDRRFTRAALVRATVAAAVEAPPGALFALAVHVADDLAHAAELPAPAREALDRCQRIIDKRP